MAIVLTAIVIGFSFLLKTTFGWVIVTYLVFNFVYSKIFKHIVIIDVFCIGGFFLLRIVAGSVVSDVALSHWIVIMVVLLALFLGFNKRRQELKLLSEKGSLHRRVLGQYNIYFIDQMTSVITSSIVISYALYTVDVRTQKEFGSNHLMLSIPFVYYGIFRYLYLIHRLKKEGDPTRIIFYDRKLQLNIIFWLIVCILIIYFKI